MEARDGSQISGTWGGACRPASGGSAACSPYPESSILLFPPVSWQPEPQAVSAPRSSLSDPFPTSLRSVPGQDLGCRVCSFR